MPKATGAAMRAVAGAETVAAGSARALLATLHPTATFNRLAARSAPLRDVAVTVVAMAAATVAVTEITGVVVATVADMAAMRPRDPHKASPIRCAPALT